VPHFLQHRLRTIHFFGNSHWKVLFILVNGRYAREQLLAIAPKH
jgi:hypothetical protein